MTRIVLTPEQNAAVEALRLGVVRNASVLSLSGAAGTGKTTIIRSLKESISGQVAVVTPTNKAAKVLNSKGIDAATIHATFFVLIDTKPPRFEAADEYLLTNPKLPAGKMKFCEVIIVDEASMVPTWMIAALRRMSNTLILVGDANQLPPIGDRRNPRGYFNTLEHTAVLNEVHRQKGESLILKAATEVRTDSPKAESALRYFAPVDHDFSGVVAGAWSGSLPKLIAFTNRERARINQLVRYELGLTLIDNLPQPGEPLMCVAAFDDVLLNGTEVEVVAFDWPYEFDEAQASADQKFDYLYPWLTYRVVGEEEVRQCRFDLCAFLRDLPKSIQNAACYQTLYAIYSEYINKNGDDVPSPGARFQWGYCITCHKAQGSEYPAVVVIDQRNVVKSMTAQQLEREFDPANHLSPDEAARRWIYTAITRAQSHLLVAPTFWAKLSNNYLSVAA